MDTLSDIYTLSTYFRDIYLYIVYMLSILSIDRVSYVLSTYCLYCIYSPYSTILRLKRVFCLAQQIGQPGQERADVELVERASEHLRYVLEASRLTKTSVLDCWVAF